MKTKKILRRAWTKADLMKWHSKARTPIVKVSKQMKRTIGALRVKATNLGIGLGHQRARKKDRLRCHKRPKSREETPKEGSDSGWGTGGGVATAYPI